MSDRDQINRRDFIVTTAGVAGGASALAGGAIAPARGQTTPPLPSGIDEHSPLAQYWEKPVAELVGRVDLKAHVPELSNESVKERHRIYCFLLMALIQRFWNGNKRGPLGVYPYRVDQKAPGQDPQAKFFRYRGDMIKDEDQFRVNWDRYLGHNIACIAVDGNGEVIDFDFNHNDFFRSSTEHAESRMVRRLFSLADVFDNWRTGEPIPGKSRAFSLQDVTLYTSLESCAQCSGVMSLGRVRQVVYLQYDPGTYRVGNIMVQSGGPRSGGSIDLVSNSDCRIGSRCTAIQPPQRGIRKIQKDGPRCEKSEQPGSSIFHSAGRRAGGLRSIHIVVLMHRRRLRDFFRGSRRTQEPGA
jgi:tRNA(Arg) A34 adenosine deaminase TadA